MTCSCARSQSFLPKLQLSVWFSFDLSLSPCYNADWRPLVCFGSTSMAASKEHQLSIFSNTQWSQGHKLVSVESLAKLAITSPLLMILASAPLHTQDTEIGFGCPGVTSANERLNIRHKLPCSKEEQDRMQAEIARQKMKTGCQQDRESEKKREQRVAESGRFQKTIRCYPVWTVKDDASRADRVRYCENWSGRGNHKK